MGQDGGVASTCVHGFAPADCLICRTLGASTKTADPPRRAGRRPPDPPTPTVAVTPTEILKPARPPRRFGGHVAMVVAGALAIALAFVLLSGIVFTILRLLELVVVAAGAGWVGYRLGYLRGKHHHSPR